MKRLLSWLSTAVLAAAGLLVSTGSPAFAAAPPPDGYYVVYNARSLDCLDQSYSGGVERPQVYAFECNGRANQVWELESDGTSFTLTNVFSQKCLNQSYSGGVERVDVIAFSCLGSSPGDNTHWGMPYKVGGLYVIGNRKSGKCLDQSYADGTPQIRVLAFTCKSHSELTTSVTNQHWFLVNTRDL
ncbi:RICIN domain-containing protein [Actinoplanes sp. CA-252034]|uniref:RICIN domain-containing protein n=1 Tax=Actinoplanes sp. CA-252034 TaxID=3239906 RepID=UPI003D980125